MNELYELGLKSTKLDFTLLTATGYEKVDAKHPVGLPEKARHFLASSFNIICDAVKQSFDFLLLNATVATQFTSRSNKLGIKK